MLQCFSPHIDDIDQCSHAFTLCQITKLSDSLASERCVLCIVGDMVSLKSLLSFLIGVAGYFRGPVYFRDCPSARGGFATKFGISMLMLPLGIIATI
jgi:hypothetical protein